MRERSPDAQRPPPLDGAGRAVPRGRPRATRDQGPTQARCSRHNAQRREPPPGAQIQSATTPRPPRTIAATRLWRAEPQSRRALLPLRLCAFARPSPRRAVARRPHPRREPKHQAPPRPASPLGVTPTSTHQERRGRRIRPATPPDRFGQGRDPIGSWPRRPLTRARSDRIMASLTSDEGLIRSDLGLVDL